MASGLEDWRDLWRTKIVGSRPLWVNVLCCELIPNISGIASSVLWLAGGSLGLFIVRVKPSMVLFVCFLAM